MWVVWRNRLGFTLLYGLAAALGLASAWVSVRTGAGLAQAAGPWQVSMLAGSADADAHTRARVALGGLLALNREETMYYVARTDSTGRPLHSRCSYLVSGVPPQARWWSVTAYADDLFLFADEGARYSINSLTAVLDAAGRFRFISAPEAPAATQLLAGSRWLPTPGLGRGLIFTLRVYNPAPALAAAPAALEPPRIERLAGAQECAP